MDSYLAKSSSTFRVNVFLRFADAWKPEGTSERKIEPRRTQASIQITSDAALST